MRLLVSALLLVALARSAAADGAPMTDDDGNRANMRVGVSTTDDNGRPTICLEVTAFAQLSFEGCGTGSGFLHTDPGQELAHFRLKWAVYRRKLGGGTLRAQVGGGFAELEVGQDSPGFEFGEPGQGATAAAGPEASASVQWMRSLGKGWELVGSFTGGMAWIPHAPDLILPRSEAQPFASFELGVGW